MRCCTLFAFSMENWSCHYVEITLIFCLIEEFLQEYQIYDLVIREGRVQIQLHGNINNLRVPLSMQEELRMLERTSAKVCNGRMQNRRRAARLDNDGDLGINSYGGINDNDNNDNCNNVLMACLAISYRTPLTPFSLTQHCIQCVHFSSRELHNEGVHRLLIVDKSNLRILIAKQ
jgi:hypothetical protein